MKEHVFEARDLLVAQRSREPVAVGARVSEAVGAQPAQPRATSTARAARRRPGDRARHAPRRAVHRAAARRHGRRDHQGRADPGQPDPIREWGKARYEGRSLWWPVQSRNKKCVTLNLRAERGQELLLELAEQADVLVGELPARHARALEPRLRADVGGEPGARPRAHLRLRPDRARTRSAPASPRSPRRWAGSATSTAFPASRRRASTSRSATRSPGCSPRRGSSPRSTGATRSAAGAARSSTSR